jgi:hypothetical protein
MATRKKATGKNAAAATDPAKRRPLLADDETRRWVSDANSSLVSSAGELFIAGRVEEAIAACDEAIKADPGERSYHMPVAIICDEAAALGHLPILQNTVALMRGYGLKLFTIWQDLAQLQSIYKNRWESFIGNAGVLQSFSAQDVVTAEYLSKRTGQTTRQALSLGLSQNLQAGAPPSYSTSATSAPIPIPLMLPQDIRNMDDGYTVLFSHRIKGTARAYLPFPTEIKGLEAICAQRGLAQCSPDRSGAAFWRGRCGSEKPCRGFCVSALLWSIISSEIAVSVVVAASSRPASAQGLHR